MPSTSAPLDAAPPLGQVARVMDVFVSPTKTFLDILRSASWWLPFVLLVLSGLGSGYVVERQVGFELVVANQMKSSPSAQDRMNQIPAEQRGPAIARQAMVTKILTYASAVPVMLFFALYSLVVWATFNFGLGAQTRFGQVFAVVFYAALPYVLRAVLTWAMLLFGGDAEGFDLRNPVGSNPAFFMPDAAPWVRALLARIDVFELWVVGLTVLGMAVISKKSLGQSAAVIGGFYVLGTLVAVGFAAAF